VERIKEKYWKPTSVSWWASFVPLVIGIIIASEPVHGWAEVVEALNRMCGNIPAYVLINGGLAGIGFRGRDVNSA